MIEHDVVQHNMKSHDNIRDTIYHSIMQLGQHTRYQREQNNMIEHTDRRKYRHHIIF